MVDMALPWATTGEKYHLLRNTLVFVPTKTSGLAMDIPAITKQAITRTPTLTAGRNLVKREREAWKTVAI